MSEDIVEKSIQCLANAKLNDTTYEVARDIVLQELQQKENIIKEVRERLIKPSKFIERTERLKLLEILDKER